MKTEVSTVPGIAPEATTKTITEKLTTPERKRFEKCEKTILNHFETFREAGEALRIIRDERLYRETHRTFEQYARTRWDMSKTQANRLIAAARVVAALSAVAPKELTDRLTESAVRPLTGLSESDQTKVFARLAEEVSSAPGGTVPAKIVFDVARATVPKFFDKPKPKTKKGGAPPRGEEGDLIRRSELLEELNKWEHAKRKARQFDLMSAKDVIAAVRDIIRKV